jgi:spermidine/putrescine-binding protein
MPVPLLDTGEFELYEALEAALPPWGGVLIEYDWVIPANAPDPDAALAFLETLPPAPAKPSLPLVPLAPLPDRTQAQHAHFWASLTRPRRSASA